MASAEEEEAEDGFLETTAHASYSDCVYWLQLGHLQGVDREIEYFVNQQASQQEENSHQYEANVVECVLSNYTVPGDDDDDGEAKVVENGFGVENVEFHPNDFELVRAEPFYLKESGSDYVLEDEVPVENNYQAMGNLQAGDKKSKGGGGGGGSGDGTTSGAHPSTSHLGVKEKSSGSPRIMRMFSSGAKKHVAPKVPAPVPVAQPQVVHKPIAHSVSTHSQLSPPTTLESTPFATPPSKDENVSDGSPASSSDTVFTASLNDQTHSCRSKDGHQSDSNAERVAAYSQPNANHTNEILDLQQIAFVEFDKSASSETPTTVSPLTAPSNVTTPTLPTTPISKIRNGNLLPASGVGGSGNSGGEMKSWEERISSALSGFTTHARRQDNGRNLVGETFTNSPFSIFSSRVSSENEVIAEAEEDQMGVTNGSATEMTTNNNCRSHAFTISKHKKINLSPTASPSTSTPATPDMVTAPTPVTDGQMSCASLRRHSSYGDVPLGEQSNVLRKVASLTLDRATIEEKVNKPKFVPEKLDFKIYEKFEGQMLLNWFCSAFNEGHYLNNVIKHDLKIIGVQFCTHLLACGVLQQIEDADAPLESLFKPDRMYFWTHLEVPTTASIIPGKIQESTKSLFISEKVGENSSVTSKPNAAVNGIDPEMRTDEALETLKLNYKQELDRIQRENESVIARIQSEHTTEGEVLRDKIQQLEREVEKYKTLADIQSLTRQVNDDFSPTTQNSISDSKTLQPSSDNSENTSQSGLPHISQSVSPPPPPPPMPGMGPPPPPPMPGVGPPPPPPMPGMGPPPPPPMPGMGPPPPPPMPGMGPGPPPPPPPMPGMGPPPPPPMSGIPPPPPLGSKLNGGPAPFPTPPPGGWGYEPQMRKAPINPKVPMKPLYWTRIQLNMNVMATPNQEKKENIWDKVEEINLETMDDFIDFFARQVVEKKAPTKAKVLKTSKVQSAKLLDSKRAQMVGILVSSHHLEIAEVENAVYNFDTTVLDLDALQAIYEVRANDEELKSISSHLAANPDVPLDKPEQFLHELSQIPHFADRIACFTFQSTFHENVAVIENKLNNMEMTCELLMKSEDVKNILGLVLTFGNYMNGGNRQRGQADGFGIEILSKLKDVKSKDGSFTLLHYIVKAFVRKYDENAGTDKAKLPVPEPSDVEKAATVKFDDIQADLTKLHKELKDYEKRAAKVIEVSEVDHLEPFKTNMEGFFMKGGDNLKEQEATLKSCISIFDKLIKCYQWSPKAGDDAQPKDFFAAWITFCTDFKDVWKKEQQKVFKERIDRLLKSQSKEIVTTPKEKAGLKWRLGKKKT